MSMKEIVDIDVKSWIRHFEKQALSSSSDKKSISNKNWDKKKIIIVNPTGYTKQEIESGDPQCSPQEIYIQQAKTRVKKHKDNKVPNLPSSLNTENKGLGTYKRKATSKPLTPRRKVPRPEPRDIFNNTE